MTAPKKKPVPPSPPKTTPRPGSLGTPSSYVGPKAQHKPAGEIVPAVPARKKAVKKPRTSASRKLPSISAGGTQGGMGPRSAQSFETGDPKTQPKIPFIGVVPHDEPPNFAQKLAKLASAPPPPHQNPTKTGKPAFKPRYEPDHLLASMGVGPAPEYDADEGSPLSHEAERPSLRDSGGTVSSRSGEDAGEMLSGRASTKNKRASNELQKISSTVARDIAGGFDPSTINWERRNKCKVSLIDFAYTYYSSIFYESMSADHYRVAERLQDATDNGGLYSLAMPRGQGKTAWSRAAVARAVIYGLRRFVVYVGASEKKAVQSLNNIKTFLFTSTLLMEDFPEICWSVRNLEGRSARAAGQLFNRVPTAVEWYNEQIRLPSLSLSVEQAAFYPEEELLRSNGLIVPRSAGVVLKGVGIDGSIRGDAETHPVTLEQPRPDLVVLDDIQKDQGALNPDTVAKLCDVVDGTVLGLAGPGKAIAAVMPCTVIQKGDLSDTYLDREKKPKWRGERCSLVLKWPLGIDNDAITYETEAGKLWNQYGDVRRESLQRFGDNRLGNVFYIEHREAMDAGYEVSWPARYNKDPGPEQEISAQQSAMHFRLDTNTFLSEYQNVGRTPPGLREMPFTAEDVAKRVSGLERGVIPYGTHALTCYIDVQNEILFYVVGAFSHNMTGVIVEYGTWPKVETLNFTKEHAGGWSLLSRNFIKAYPKLAGSVEKTPGGKPRAPLDAKIYWALDECTKWLMAREWPVDNVWESASAVLGNMPNEKAQALARQLGTKQTRRIDALGIDGRWGLAADAVKTFYKNRRSTVKELVYCLGFGINPGQRQLEQYERRPGWLFEDMVNPLTAQQVRWVFQPAPDQTYQYLKIDADRAKSYLVERLACAPGTPGSLLLHKGTPAQHALYAKHLAESERPEESEVTGPGGRKKEVWRATGTNQDNDFMDCTSNVCILATFKGCRLQPSGSVGPIMRKPRRRLSDSFRSKNGE